MNKYSPLLFVMIFSFLFGDANVQIRLQNGQKSKGEFIGTYMNHVHILIGEKIIYYSCDDIISITYTSEGLSTGKGFNYDCSRNTVTADILFPPQLDPMTGEITQMLPDVFNPDIPKPVAKVEVGVLSTEQDFVVIDGVKYARVSPEKEVSELTKDQKDSLYLSSKKSALIAGALSYVLSITGSGHLYAGGGDVKVWSRSLPYSLALVIFMPQQDEPEEGPRSPFGFLAAIIGLIWDSVYMTNKYNIKLHNEIYDNEIQKVLELKQFESELILR